MTSSTRHLYILTGASRGMGLAMAEQLLSPENFLICISRQVNDALAGHARQAGCQLEQWPMDLSRGEAVAHSAPRLSPVSAGGRQLLLYAAALSAPPACSWQPGRRSSAIAQNRSLTRRLGWVA